MIFSRRLLNLRYFLFVLSLSLGLNSQSIDLKFDTFPATITHCFHQDSLGFMWIGTQEGILRFDGYNFKNYTHIPFDSMSLSNDWVFCIDEDRYNNLWIGTFGGGLNCFNQKTEKFTRFAGSAKNNQNNPITKIIANDDGSVWFSGSMYSLTHLKLGLDGKSLYTHYNFINEPVTNSLPSKNTALTLYKDKQGTIWIGMATEGLIRFNPATGEKKQYKHDPDNFDSISHNTISSICEDDSGNIWIGTGHLQISQHGGGLNMFNRRTEKFKHFKRDWSGKNSICSNIISALLIDYTGTMWIGTPNNYINTVPVNDLLSEKEPFFQHYKNLSRSTVLALYEDRSGNIWIGLMNKQSHKFDRQQNSFALFSRNDNYPNSLTQTGTWTVYSDHSGKLWFGTNGLDVYDTETGNFKHFYHDPKDTTGLSANMISGIQEDPEGNVWIATMHNGINILNPKSGVFKHIRYNPNVPNGLGSNSIQFLLARRNGDTWLASQDVGIQLYERNTGNFYTYDLNAETNEDFLVSNLCEDRRGVLWIGTNNNGIYSLHIDENKNPQIVHYSNDPQNLSSLSCNDVSDIIQPAIIDTAALWIATKTGLNRFDLNTKSFKHFYREHGMSSNLVLKILEDNEGNLWCSTTNGISVYRMKTGKILNYGKGDGMPFTSFGGFRQNAAKDLRGNLYFAGGNGVLSFIPQDIRENPNIPPIIITGFSVFQEQIKLDTTIQYKRSITLDHVQNMFSFDFAALNFTNPEKNQYKYKMEGFLNDWISIGNDRRASFTNLDPGEYIFRVIGSNNHGIWNEEGTSIKVIILPPWWRANFAYALYIIFIAFAIWLIWHFQTNRLKMRQQLELEHLHAEKLEEVDHLKSQFFANISHEFRTPLTLILGPVRQMFSGEFKGNFKEQYKSIIRNAERLLNLINQLLDLSKLEIGKLKLQTQSTEIINLTNGLVQAFESLAVQKEITLKFLSELKSQDIFIDVDKYEKIINNLLSNAFKFTPDGGEIEIVVSKEPTLSRFSGHPSGEGDKKQNPLSRGDKGVCESIEIKISNTGQHIPENQINKIFDRFYQANNSNKKDNEGTGIGLALTKELVELHHGEIKIESEPDNKTTFIVLLPLGKEHLKKDEIIEPTAQISPLTKGELKGVITTAKGDQPISQKHSPVSSLQSPMILIVEDNSDLRKYIRSNIEDSYQILEAENGIEGWKQATKEIPDLIISDVMMPEMDGIELCNKLKTDQRTSHIPVILLTARAAKEDKIEGLETGADDFISKPFDAEELRIRIKNLIDQRKKLREQFSKQSNLVFDQITHTSADEKFVNQLMEIITLHLSDSNFNLESLSNEAGMSQMHLHRKIKGLFGLSPAEFVKTIRLKRSAEMLKIKTGNVSEIAYQVGFDNPAYFSTCFRQQFGISPSSFVKNRH